VTTADKPTEDQFPDEPAYTRETVLDALPTMKSKAQKIRSLARARFLRTEIADLLGIRYQHVRHVLERSGISAGRTRDVVLDREPVVAEIATEAGEAEREPAKASYLLSSGGFKRIGEWRLVAGAGFDLSDPAPKEPGVYAFVVDDEIVYVGLTITGLHTRMGHYRRGNENMVTSKRVNGLILEALQAGSKVEVLVAMPRPAEWHSMPVNSAAGLEAGLISHLLPRWNIRGAGRRKGAAD
jgi:hypothetical protein